MVNKKYFYSIKELTSIIPVSLCYIYKACKTGDIPSISIGGRKFVPSWYVDEITQKPQKTKRK